MKKGTRYRGRVLRTASTLLPGLLSMGPAFADPNDAGADGDLYFDDRFLAFGSSSADVKRFSRPNAVIPGTYLLDVYVNDRWVSREDIVFRDDANGVAQACVTPGQLQSWRVDPNKLKDQPWTDQADACAPIDQLLEGATATPALPDNRVNISIPTLSLLRPTSDVAPELWHKGSTAAFLGYNLNASSNQDSWNAYAGLNAGVNVARWHLRHFGSLTSSEGGGTSYRPQTTYAQRDVPSLRAQLIVGQTFTDSQLFDSFRLTGLRLSSDERMYLRSETGYAPVVRGTASSNAQVVVRQRGRIVYEATVAPGQFEITDLPDTGYAGDLDVTVIEATGQTTTFTVPYAAAANVLREGVDRFSLALGRMDRPNNSDGPDVVQATYMRGLTSSLTAYGGVTFSEDYFAAQVGGGLNTRFGAMSMDWTSSKARVHGNDRVLGDSFRFRYSKTFHDAGTTMSFGSLRYNSAGFMSLEESVAARESNALASDRSWRAKSRLDLSISQRLGAKGSFYVTGSRIEYNGGASSTTYNGGFNTTLRQATVGLGVSRTAHHNPFEAPRESTVYSLSVNVPLGRSPRRPMLTSYVTQGRDMPAQRQLGMSGSAGDDGRLTYHAAASLGEQDSLSAGLSFAASAANISVNAGRYNGDVSGGVTMNGGVVAHSGGLTLTPSVGDTMAIIHAPGARGARIGGGSSRIDRRGYGVVSHLTPYRMNEVALDAAGMANETELLSSVASVAPHFGAIVPLRFKTITGRPTLIQAQLETGEKLPLGSRVVDDEGREVGLVAQGGQVFARYQAGALLNVEWAPGQVCRLDLAREPATNQSNIDRASGVCRVVVDAVAQQAM